MLRKIGQFATLTLLAAGLAVPASAGTKITYAIQGSPTAVRWAQQSFPLKVQIDRRVASAFPGAQQVVERAFQAWAAIPETDIAFDLQYADGLKSGNDSRNTVTISDTIFANQNAIALTTYTFDGQGRFTDADIQVDKSMFQSDYNIQSTMQHEIGHMLGLDHSAVLTSIMYPYVGRGTATPVFDTDDTIAISTSYSKHSVDLLGGTLQGRVMGDGGGIFAAQVVAVNTNGQAVATGLTDSSGQFTVQGIPPGRYRVYAEPLDGPVEQRDLNGLWRQGKALAFPTQFISGEIEVKNGEVVGNLLLTTAGPVRLNPKWIGASWNGRQDFSLSTTPISVKPGDTVMIAVSGDGFTSGMTQFEVLNPAFRRVGEFKWSSNYVCAQFTVDGAVTGGSATILVRNSETEVATLTGALRIHRLGGTGGKRRAA